MASPRAIDNMTAKAVQDIQTASTALAEKFDLEIQPLPNVVRYDAEYGRAVQLQHLANTLTQIAIATKAAKEDEFGESEDTFSKSELNRTKKAEVVEIAEEKGLDIDSSMKKSEIVEEILEAQETKPIKKKGK
jgi:hypothetical protein